MLEQRYRWQEGDGALLRSGGTTAAGDRTFFGVRQRWLRACGFMVRRDRLIPVRGRKRSGTLERAWRRICIDCKIR